MRIPEADIKLNKITQPDSTGYTKDDGESSLRKPRGPPRLAE
jgi:hypothetical protein